MQNVINFIKVYWKEILEIIAIVASIVICCIKKKPVKVVDTIKELILKVLPGYILLAELQEGFSGSDKLAFVLNKVKELLKAMSFGDDVIASYLPYTRDQVEQILATPQKKERR